MKRILPVLFLLLFSQANHAQWLEDTVINDRSTTRNRTGYNNARGIAPDGDRIYAVWIEEGLRIFLRAKIDDSLWLPSEEVSVGSPGGIYGISTYPSIAVQNGEIHVVWEDYRTGDYEVFYRRFSSGWGSPLNLTGDTAQSRSPVITITNSGRRFLVWQDNRSGIYEIYGKIYENGSWGATEMISAAALYAGFPTIACYNETVHAVWEELENNGYELYHAVHSGGSWSSPQRITDAEGSSIYPSLCTDPAGTLHLVFSDDRNGSFDVFYKRFNGSTWSDDSIQTWWNPGEALYPQIAADPYGILHLVWSGNHQGSYEISYKKRLANGQWSPDTLLSFNHALSSLPHVAATADGSVHTMWYDWVDEPGYVSPHIRYRRYNATMEPLSEYIGLEVAAHGVWINACIPAEHLTLFRIVEPYPLTIEQQAVKGDTVVWYEELLPGTYRYVVQVMNGTTIHYSHPLEVRIPERKLPLSLKLFPNPFTTSTTIHLNGILQGEKGMELQIFDVAGRMVKEISIPNSQFPVASFVWDGKDTRGKTVAPGVYFIQHQGRNTILTQKAIKL